MSIQLLFPSCTSTGCGNSVDQLGQLLAICRLFIPYCTANLEVKLGKWVNYRLTKDLDGIRLSGGSWCFFSSIMWSKEIHFARYATPCWFLSSAITSSMILPSFWKNLSFLSFGWPRFRCLKPVTNPSSA